MRKKSAYRPKHVRLDCMNYVQSGFAPVREQPETTTLRMKNHASLEEITKGRAARIDIDIMIAALNMTEALAMVRDELGADWREEIKVAQDALLSMALRGVAKANRFVFTGPELQAVNLAMEIHDAQLDACTVDELQKALALCKHIIRTGRARVIPSKVTA